MSNRFRPGVFVRPEDVVLTEQKENFESRILELEARIRQLTHHADKQQELIEKQRTALYNAEISKDMLKRELQRYTGLDTRALRAWGDPHARDLRELIGVPVNGIVVHSPFGGKMILPEDVVDKSNEVPEVERVIYSGPKTIVVWKDGSKTMVSPCEGQQKDDYAAFCAAVVKKLFGSTAKAKKFLSRVRKDQVKKSKKTSQPEVIETPVEPDR